MHDASNVIRAKAFQDGECWTLDVMLSWDVEDPFEVEVIFANAKGGASDTWKLPIDLFMQGVYLRRYTLAHTGDAFFTPIDEELVETLRHTVPMQYLGEEHIILHLRGTCQCGEHVQDSSVFMPVDPLRVFCDAVNEQMQKVAETVVL